MYKAPLRLSIRITLTLARNSGVFFPFLSLIHLLIPLVPAPVLMLADVPLLNAGDRLSQLDKLQSLLREDVGPSKQFPLFAFLLVMLRVAKLLARPGAETPLPSR